jgi:nitrate reductase gamma subunit
VDRALRLTAILGLLVLAAGAWAQDAASGASPGAPAITAEAASGGSLSDTTTGPTAALRDAQAPAGFSLYDAVRGPAFIAAWVIFALGVAYRAVQYVRLTVRGDRLVAGRPGVPAGAPAGAPAARPSGPGFAGRGSRPADLPFIAGAMSPAGRLWMRLRLRARATILGSNPVMAVVSSGFHVLLFLAPLLLPAHNILFDLAFRVSLPTLPEPVLDVCTLVVIAAGVFFLVRRLASARVRALTTARDWLVLGLVLAPFLTAFLAYHQLLEYRLILLAHMLAGEAVIAVIPFTAIGHMPFILFARFFTAGEYSWRPARRVWR